MAQSDRIIVLFPRWFPYNKVKEQSFLVEELDALAGHFKEVHIVPQQIEGDKYQLDSRFKVDETLAQALTEIGFMDKAKTVLSVDFLQELVKIKFNRNKMRYAIAARLAALVTRKWIKSFVKNKENVVLYSFWMDFTTLAFAMTKDENQNVKAVSRCHNFDIYGNTDNDFYVPYQQKMVESMDGVYPDSFGGEEFLINKFPNSACKAAIMGVRKPLSENTGSTDGIVRILSCAYMIPRKRVGLFLDGLILVSQLRPELKIEWTHIGGGPDFDEVQERSKKLTGETKATFTGNMSTEELSHYYANTPIDLFVNTSTKEGTPVSIMEAISRSIPLMATAFGGNKEIVDLGAGVGLSPDPTPNEIADKLIELIDSGGLKRLKLESKKVWDDHYNSEKNYEEFCERIALL